MGMGMLVGQCKTWLRKRGPNLGNSYQMDANKTPGGGAKRRPCGATPEAAPCCLYLVRMSYVLLLFLVKSSSVMKSTGLFRPLQ